MKTMQLIMAIMLFTVFTNCNNDDDSNNVPNTTNWSLTHVVGGIAGVDQTFPAGLITWKFNAETEMLVVVNNNTDENVIDILDSGTYPYTIQETGTNNLIVIDGIEFGEIVITETEVTIDQQIADGFLITLTR